MLRPARRRSGADADGGESVRQGNYRILYTVADAELTVEVVKVGHRRNVYREG